MATYFSPCFNLEEDKFIVVLNNPFLLSKIWCQTSCYYHRKKRALLRTAKARNISLLTVEI